ncbi:type II secretion system F family protein [Roseibium sp.]|uniref:type II secretion system F family protein n=1 Tax=Roseibium sp. TaxID=1936156 RepID=UPI003BAE4ADF
METVFVLCAGLTGGLLAWTVLSVDFRKAMTGDLKSENPVDRFPLSRPIVNSLAPLLRRLLPESMARLERHMVLAGRPYGGVGAAEFLSLGILLSLVSVIVFGAMMSISDIGTGTKQLLLLMSLVLPLLWAITSIRTAYVKRTRDLDNQFPYFLDFLVMMKEAGDTLPSALELYVAASPKMALSDAISVVVRGTNAHKEGLHGAIRDFIDTCPSEIGRSTLQSILRSENMGARSTAMLRDISRDLREKRYEKAEKAAEALKARSMFPMVIMFAGTFLIILSGSLGKMFTGLPG